jgi:hypothetical protein
MIKALACVIALLCLTHIAAYGDSDFLRDWKDWNNHGGTDAGKTRNLVSSRRNVFKVPKDNNNAEKKSLEDGMNVFDVGFTDVLSGTDGDITPFIVGGTVVDPPRKYKVPKLACGQKCCLPFRPQLQLTLLTYFLTSYSL